MPPLTGLELHFCFPGTYVPGFPVAPVAAGLSPLKAKGTRLKLQLCGLKRISRRVLPTVLVLIIEPIQILGAADPYGGLEIRVREQPFGTP